MSTRARGTATSKSRYLIGDDALRAVTGGVETRELVVKATVSGGGSGSPVQIPELVVKADVSGGSTGWTSPGDVVQWVHSIGKGIV